MKIFWKIIKKLKKNNALLSAGNNGDLGNTKHLKKLGYEGNDLKEKENLIGKIPKNNEIIGNQKLE